MKFFKVVIAALCWTTCLFAGQAFAGIYNVQAIQGSYSSVQPPVLGQYSTAQGLRYATIQAAVNVASSNSIINVGPGVYRENLNFGTKQMITVKGTNGATATIIDGGGTAPIVTVGQNALQMAGMPVVLTGFTLQNGYSATTGGVAAVGSRSELSFADCIIWNNRAGSGGAFAVSDAGGILTVRNSLITNNTATNAGGAFYLNLGGKVNLINSTITANKAVDGASIYQSYGATVTGLNNIIFGNVTNDGTASNPIFNGPLTATLTYSDIEGGLEGAGNINADPNFVNPASGNFQLAADSPAIDTGIVNTATPTKDLLGVARPQGTALDMGSYEYLAPVQPPADVTPPTADSFVISGTSGPTATVTVTFSEPVAFAMPTVRIGNLYTVVTVSGSVATIRLAGCCFASLQPGVEYILTIPAGSFKDAAGNPNALITMPVTFGSAPAPVDGTCGKANGGIFAVVPTVDLCATGTASAVSGTTSYAWTCTGSNGGATANCSALYQPADVTPPTADSFVISGTSGPTATVTVTFSEPVAFAMPTVRIGNLYTVVTVNGSVATIRLAGCCFASLQPGVEYILTIPAGSFRDAAGNPNALITIPVTFGSAPAPVNGVCGSANGGLFTVAPATNLCSVGMASTVTGTGSFAWTCAGSNGGTTASCTAQLLDTTPPAVVSTVVNRGTTVAADVITVTFTEPVVKARTLDSIMKIGIADTTSTVSGSTVSIKVKNCCLNKVKAGKTYILTIPAGSFKDAAGNLNAAFSVPVTL